MKIDEFEGELNTEKQLTVKTREQAYLRCETTQNGQTTDTNNRNTQIATEKTNANNAASFIAGKKVSIQTDLNAENSQAAALRVTIDDTATKYASHWEESEDRHAVIVFS